MYVNPDQLVKLETELADVAEAIKTGKTVHSLDNEGWTKTKQVNLHLSRSDYHIGETAPE